MFAVDPCCNFLAFYKYYVSISNSVLRARNFIFLKKIQILKNSLLHVFTKITAMSTALSLSSFAQQCTWHKLKYLVGFLKNK